MDAQLQVRTGDARPFCVSWQTLKNRGCSNMFLKYDTGYMFGFCCIMEINTRKLYNKIVFYRNIYLAFYENG